MIKIMKQTAIEWLIDNSHIIPKNELNKKELIEKAKELEKEQILKALKMGVNIELGINEFKDLHLTYNQAFDKYIKDNYED